MYVPQLICAIILLLLIVYVYIHKWFLKTVALVTRYIHAKSMPTTKICTLMKIVTTVHIPTAHHSLPALE